MSTDRGQLLKSDCTHWDFAIRVNRLHEKREG